jgi:DNA segregation ATPase FtsK/SpoIIIE-like protein
MRIALRTATAVETDIVLGQGATDAGAESHLIPLASPANGYATAGIGFMRVEGDPEPVRVRLPYVDDAQIAEWSTEFKAERAARQIEFTMDNFDQNEPEGSTAQA